MTTRDVESLRRAIPYACNFFGLGLLLKIKELIECANANFLVRTDKGDFFIKVILEPHTKENKLIEVAYIEKVATYSIPTPLYLPGKERREFIFEFDGVMVMAQPEVSGKQPLVTMANVSQVGSVLGRLSLVPCDSLPYRYGWLSPEYVDKNLKALKGDFADNSDASKILSIYESCRKFEDEILPILPRGIIHADLHSENVLFEDNKLTAVVDWEDSAISASLMDFASSAIYWCFSDGKVRPRLYKVFYDSYTKERPLTNLEIQHLNDCLKYVGALQTMWRFLNYEKCDRKEALWALELEPLPM